MFCKTKIDKQATSQTAKEYLMDKWVAVVETLSLSCPLLSKVDSQIYYRYGKH